MKKYVKMFTYFPWIKNYYYFYIVFLLILDLLKEILSSDFGHYILNIFFIF